MKVGPYVEPTVPFGGAPEVIAGADDSVTAILEEVPVIEGVATSVAVMV